jgi:hypothetical protein
MFGKPRVNNLAARPSRESLRDHRREMQARMLCRIRDCPPQFLGMVSVSVPVMVSCRHLTTGLRLGGQSRLSCTRLVYAQPHGRR